MKNSNNIEKDRFSEIIKSKLENYSLPPENVSWNELEKRLSAKETSKKQALRPWISGLSVAASIALVWFLYPLINNKSITKNEQQHTQLSRDKEGFSESVFADTNISFDCVASKKITSILDGQTFNENGTRQSPATPRFELIQPKDVKLALKPRVVNSSKKRLMAGITNFDRYLSSSVYDVAIPKKQSSLGLHFSSGGLFPERPAPISGSLRSAPIPQNPPPFLQEVILTPDDFNRKIYRPPLSFGLSVRKELNRTFSVETGLIYTYLSTTFENPYPLQEAFLDLHYLGIPLNLITNIYGNHHTRWNLYCLFGGTVEKGIFSQYIQRSYSESSYERINLKKGIAGFQGSLQSSLGLNFRIANNYSVYLEPGVRYYITNNQPLSVRTEFPLVVLNLNIGLRYNW